MKVALTSLLATLILAVGLLSYVLWEYNSILNAASILAVVAYIFSSGMLPWVRTHGLIFCLTVGIFSGYMLTMGLLSAQSLSQVTVQVSYVLSFLFFSLYGYKFFVQHRKSVLWVAISIFVYSGFLSLLGYFFGISLNGNRQGFLGFPALQGLAQNVNYNVVMILVSIFILIALMRRISLAQYLIGAGVVALILLMSGSRGGALAFTGALLGGLLFRLGARWSVLIFAVLAVASSIYLFTNIEALQQQLVASAGDLQGVRLEKGLNNRDVIWLAVINMIQEKPWLGWGDINVIERTMVYVYGSHGASVQNGYLMMALRVGLLGVMLWGISMLYAVYQAAGVVRSRELSKVQRREVQYIFTALLVIMIDNFFRTYTPGGVGFIPMIMVASFSYLNYCARPQHVLVGKTGDMN